MEEPINKYYLIGGVILSLTVLVVILVIFVEIDPIQKSPAPTSQIGTGAQQGRNAFVKPAPPTPGNFIVTYQNIIDSNHKELHALSCGNGSCTSISSTALNALSGINVADQQAIAIGVDGFPIIAYRYYDGFARTLNVIHCTDKKCNSFDGPFVKTSLAPSFYSDLSIVIGSDNLPIIFFNTEQGTIQNPSGFYAFHCGKLDCSNDLSYPDTLSPLDTSYFATGQDHSVKIGPDGFPIIGYQYRQPFNFIMSLLHCTSVDCSTSDPRIPLDPIPPSNYPRTGNFPHLELDSQGNPLAIYLSYPGGNDFYSAYLYCTDALCNSPSTPLILDSTNPSLSHTGISWGSDNLPFILTSDYNAQKIYANHCSDITCNTQTTTAFDFSPHPPLVSKVVRGQDGFPIIITLVNGELQFIHCTSLDCSTSEGPTTLAVPNPATGETIGTKFEIASL